MKLIEKAKRKRIALAGVGEGVAPWGPDTIFSVEQLDELLNVFKNVRATAEA